MRMGFNSLGNTVKILFAIGIVLSWAMHADAQVPHYTYGDTGTFGSAGTWSYSLSAMILDSTDDEFSARFTAMENITVDNAWQRYVGMDAGTTVRVGIMADSGGSPSGTYLASGTRAFTASGSRYTNVVFSSSVNLTNGGVYHLVTTAPTIAGAFDIYGGGSELVRPYDRAVDTNAQHVLRRYNGGAWATAARNAQFVLCNGANVIPGPGQPYSSTSGGTSYQTRGGGGTAYGVRFLVTSKEVPVGAWVAVTNLAMTITTSGSPTSDLVLEFRETNSTVLAGATVTPAMAVGALNLTLNQPALLQQGVPYLLTARLGPGVSGHPLLQVHGVKDGRDGLAQPGPRHMGRHQPVLLRHKWRELQLVHVHSLFLELQNRAQFQLQRGCSESSGEGHDRPYPMNTAIPSCLENAHTRGEARGRALLGTAAIQQLRDAARCLAKLLAWPEAKLVGEVGAYHRERLDAEPDLARYPELRGYRDRLCAEERGMRAAGVNDDTIALAGTLGFWRDTRLVQKTGRAWRAVTQPEKCRILYVPHSDQGALHAKNVDDPLTYWTPRPRFSPKSPWPHAHPLFFDGVGSGLHLDDMPPEIFPVNVIELCKEHCATVTAAAEMLVRYNYFWAYQNLLVHDGAGQSMAFEKTRCLVAARGPNAQGINFVNGMGALDPEIRAFQHCQREAYLRQTGQTWDSPDGCFWKKCEGKWANMERYVAELSDTPSLEEVRQLMERRDPTGPMCLTGAKSHPNEIAPGCTLVMDIWFMDQKKLHRRQWRGSTPAYLDVPEIVQFE